MLTIIYLLGNCYCTLCLYVLSSVDWDSYFCITMKGSGFKQKNGRCQRLVYFQVFLGLWITCALSIMINLKIITVIFIMMSRNSKRKMKILVRHGVWIFHDRSPWVHLFYQSHTLFRWQYLKYFIFQSVLKFYILPGQLHTWLVWLHVSIFYWYGWKSKIVNVFILLYHFNT